MLEIPSPIAWGLLLGVSTSFLELGKHVLGSDRFKISTLLMSMRILTILAWIPMVTLVVWTVKAILRKFPFVSRAGSSGIGNLLRISSEICGGVLGSIVLNKAFPCHDYVHVVDSDLKLIFSTVSKQSCHVLKSDGCTSTYNFLIWVYYVGISFLINYHIQRVWIPLVIGRQFSPAQGASDSRGRIREGLPRAVNASAPAQRSRSRTTPQLERPGAAEIALTRRVCEEHIRKLGREMGRVVCQGCRERLRNQLAGPRR